MATKLKLLVGVLAAFTPMLAACGNSPTSPPPPKFANGKAIVCYDVNSTSAANVEVINNSLVGGSGHGSAQTVNAGGTASAVCGAYNTAAMAVGLQTDYSYQNATAIKIYAQQASYVCVEASGVNFDLLPIGDDATWPQPITVQHSVDPDCKAPTK